MIEFYQAYNPIFKREGISFRIVYINSERENITVEKDGSEGTITIYDGFIRHPEINRNGLRIAVCHEIGHLLAEREENAMYASERDSDAYAIITCKRDLGMNTDQILDGIESLYQWYRLYPQQKNYPSADERKDNMIGTLRRINPSF